MENPFEKCRSIIIIILVKVLKNPNSQESNFIGGPENRKVNKIIFQFSSNTSINKVNLETNLEVSKIFLIV
jgi:hypothetical protein